MTPLTSASPTQATVLHLLPLAKSLDEDKVTPGVLGFIVFAALGIAVWMLMKSMSRQMGKVDFEERPSGSGTEAQGTDATAAEDGDEDGNGDEDGDEEEAASEPAAAASKEKKKPGV